jgi:aminoacrylate hydrolase
MAMASRSCSWPGLGGSGRFWHAQVDAFARHFRVVLHDHRGVGRSGPGPLISNAGEMADDLLRAMDALGIERAHLVGHSTGGAIGQHLALRAPERIASLVLSASWAGPTPLFVQTFHTRRDVLINAGPLNYLMVGTLLATPAWYLAPRFRDTQEYFRTRLAEFPGLEVELGRLNAVMSHDLRHRLDEIRVPTFVIGARDDQLTPPGLSEELAGRIAGAKLHLLREGGHFCPQTVTEAYNEAVLGFLLAQRGSSATRPTLRSGEVVT